MDAEPDRVDRPARLPGMEREMRRERTAVLLAAQRVSFDHTGTPRRNTPTLHLYGMSEQLPLDPGPHRRRVLR